MWNERERRLASARRSTLLAIAALIALQGCAAVPVREAESSLGPGPTLDARMSIRTLGPDHRYSQVPAVLVMARLKARDASGPVNILALSGGGAGGAFGAGAIAGLTRSGTRPQMAVVTGVSAGALIAPYAFLGPAWDAKLIEAYTSGDADHLLQSRGLGALWGSSMYRGDPLRELVDHHVSDGMIAAVAREAAKGRLLLVATTDVDSGQPVFWDLGSIALHGGASARSEFRDVLVASASVPGLFPPVILRVQGDGEAYDEAHVDGGATVPFFIPAAPSGTAGVVVYVLVDGPLGEAPRPTPLRARAILSRSVSAGLYRMMRTTLELTAANAQIEGATLRYTSVPVAYPNLDAFDFRTGTMKSLFEYAYQCAASGHLWLADAALRSDDPIVSPGVGAQDVPCPADNGFIGRFAGP